MEQETDELMAIFTPMINQKKGKVESGSREI